MSLPKSKTSFVTSLRESLQEKSEAIMSEEAGLVGLKRVEPALRAAGLTRVVCKDWQEDWAVFQGNYQGFDIRLVCTDNGDMMEARGLVDVEDDGDFVSTGEDSVKWSDDFIEFFKKFLFKIVRAR